MSAAQSFVIIAQDVLSGISAHDERGQYFDYIWRAFVQCGGPGPT